MGKKSKPPPPPDYTALAKQTAEDQNKQLALQTAANRPNQVNPYGTVNWNKGPDGQWTQTETLNAAEQSQLDANRQIQAGLTSTAGGLLGQAQNSLSNPLSTAGLPAWQQYDQSKLAQVPGMSGNYGDMGQLSGNYGDMGSFDPSKLSAQGQYDPSKLGALGQNNFSAAGNSKEIQDATYNLLAPQRAQARNSEVQRLKNQGLTEDSPAFQRAIARLDTGDTDAQLKSLLAGTQEYGNVFNRSMDSANLSDRQRAQQFGEQGAMASLANQNRGQQTNEQLAQANLQNQSNQQRFGQDVTLAEFADNQNNQRFQQQEAQQRMAMMLRGQQFDEQGAMASQAQNQRNAMLNEQQALRQAPLNDLNSLMGNNPSGANFQNFSQIGQGSGVDYSGAGQNQYQAQMNAYNAKQKARAGFTSGLFGLAGSALGGPMGGMIGNAVGGMFGGGGGSGYPDSLPTRGGR